MYIARLLPLRRGKKKERRGTWRKGKAFPTNKSKLPGERKEKRELGPPPPKIMRGEGGVHGLSFPPGRRRREVAESV